jgi:hypothetical protein
MVGLPIRYKRPTDLVSKVNRHNIFGQPDIAAIALEENFHEPVLCWVVTFVCGHVVEASFHESHFRKDLTAVDDADQSFYLSKWARKLDEINSR